MLIYHNFDRKHATASSSPLLTCRIFLALPMGHMPIWQTERWPCGEQDNVPHCRSLTGFLCSFVPTAGESIWAKVTIHFQQKSTLKELQRARRENLSNKRLQTYTLTLYHCCQLFLLDFGVYSLFSSKQKSSFPKPPLLASACNLLANFIHSSPEETCVFHSKLTTLSQETSFQVPFS